MGDFMVTPEHPNGARLRPNLYGDKLEVSPFTSIVASIYYVSDPSDFNWCKIWKKLIINGNLLVLWWSWQVVINTTPLSKQGFTVTTKEGKAISVFLVGHFHIIVLFITTVLTPCH